MESEDGGISPLIKQEPDESSPSATPAPPPTATPLQDVTSNDCGASGDGDELRPVPPLFEVGSVSRQLFGEAFVRGRSGQEEEGVGAGPGEEQPMFMSEGTHLLQCGKQESQRNMASRVCMYICMYVCMFVCTYVRDCRQKLYGYCVF